MCEFLLPRLNSSLDFSSISKSEITDCLIGGIEGYNAFQARNFSGIEHLSTEEFFAATPSLHEKLHIAQSQPIQKVITHKTAFQDIFAEARAVIPESRTNKYLGIILTKPPETVVVFIPPIGVIATRDIGRLFSSSNSTNTEIIQ